MKVISPTKSAGPLTEVRSVLVGSQPGYWLTGAPHRFQYASPAGIMPTAESRLASNVLLWEQDGLILRIEGAMALEQAIRIAVSAR